MKCQKCGNELGEKDLFCKNCGTKVVTEESKDKKICGKCGNELQDTDLFCQNCGTKAKNEEVVIESQKNLSQNSASSSKNSNGKKKTIMAIIGVVLVVCIGIGAYLFFDSQPKDYKMEIDELSAIFKDGKVKEYAGDNIEVHGYLYRESIDDTPLYILGTNNKESEVFVLFTIGKEGELLDDDLGDMSELVLYGNVGKMKNSGEEIFIAYDFEVKNKVESTFNGVCSLDLGLGEDAIVSVTGTNKMLNEVSYEITYDSTIDGIYITEMNGEEREELIDILEEELANELMSGFERNQDALSFSTEIYGNLLTIEFTIDFDKMEDIDEIGFSEFIEYIEEDLGADCNKF